MDNQHSQKSIEFKISHDPEQLAVAATQHFIRIATAAIQENGQFTVALAGGSTPKAMFNLLAATPNANKLDWNKIFIFWGDERCVPADHPDSNYRMAKTTFIDKVPLPPENVFRMAGELEPEEAALLYEHQLRNHFWDSSVFDLILLGMGTDGHTASLFPGTAAVRENKRWVVAHYVEKLAAWRITFTAPLINQARYITFLTAGETKAQVLAEVNHGPYQPDILPSQIIQPDHGTLTWLIDKAAAQALPPNP